MTGPAINTRPHFPRPNSLAGLVAEASNAYAALHPKSREMFERAQGSMPGGNTRSALYFDPFPIYVDRSKGAWLTDVDGHRYLDLLGEFSAGLYGHANPVLRDATIAAFDRGASNGAPGEAEVGLAEAICARFDGIDRVRFCNSGTEANLYAILLALHATKRRKLIAFDGAYHGGVFVFADPSSPMNIDLDWSFARYNDPASALDLMDGIGRDLAAVIVEPMMSNGGSIPADPTFLQALRDKTSELGALLIFDEIVTSRMGAGGFQGMLGIRPDLTSLGKYLGAGFSFGAFGGRADLMALMDPARPGALPHAGTFNNNLFTMSAGLAGLTELFTPARAERLYRDGEDLRDRLNAAARETGVAAQFTGRGSVMTIHFTDRTITCPEDAAGIDQDLYRLFHLDLIARNVYAARRGQINLSLAVGEEEFALIEKAIRAFFVERGDLLRS